MMYPPTSATKRTTDGTMNRNARKRKRTGSQARKGGRVGEAKRAAARDMGGKRREGRKREREERCEMERVA
jgi:hypothetical protein